MELITILNRCHRFRGFVYERAHFSADKKSIEVAVRPRKGSTAVCSRCHLPAPGYNQLAERRFEFIPLWGVLVFRNVCRSQGGVVRGCKTSGCGYSSQRCLGQVANDDSAQLLEFLFRRF